jgi:DNA-directed RNA polymerase subunit RPC12/RpoP
VAGYIKQIFIENGSGSVPFNIYKCGRCKHDISESSPHIHQDNKHYCWDCSFLIGLISEKEYLKCCGIYLDNVHAGIVDEKILVYVGKHPPWIERADKHERHSTQYQAWREAVFKRDNYTCQDCRIRGGVLNAHHIKSFKRYKKLRHDINNGITLCEKCHRERHRKKVSE